ncbi:MAG TPA: peptidoglycan bridge formation glycyltransferase FemA/FemB family protein [Roseiflexaceae bacterium]|nr:peptidoglycan bridge formation glycyltransferase FemA/FemB family protein [Roseiflexaceae bacterium]
MTNRGTIHNPHEWDAFVQQHPDGHLLQLWCWGQLKEQAGWHAHRYVVRNTAGQIMAGAQLLLRRRWGFAAAYVPRGPLFSGDAQYDAQLCAELEQAARRSLAVFLRYEPNICTDEAAAIPVAALLQRRGYRDALPIQPLASIRLDLTPSTEQILAAMSKGHRADIRRAARNGVVVRTGDRQDLDRFYTILHATATRAHFGIHTPAYYAAVLEKLGSAAQLWLAEVDGVAQATAITAAGPIDAVYLYSGSTADGLRSGAQHAIQWEAIRWAQARGCRRYDFWGIPAAFTATDEAAAHADPLYGVYRFKKGFGGRIVRFMPAYDRVFLAPLYAFWRRRATAA